MTICRRRRRSVCLLGLCVLLAHGSLACGGAEPPRLTVSVPGRSMSKLPFAMAAAQGLYQKHGVDVELQMSLLDGSARDPDDPGLLFRIGRRLGLTGPPDIVVNGHGPAFIGMLRGRATPNWVALAATDCSVRDYVIARPGIHAVEELQGKRLGINGDDSTSGFAGLRLVQRMGWRRGADISIVRPAGIEELRAGEVDAIVGGDEEIEAAEREGFPIVEDSRRWNERLAGNSVLVAPDWLRDETNREAARRFLMATVEAVALFHARPELVLALMASQYGITDRAVAEQRYRRTDYMPRKPYPCADGIRQMLQLHHLDEMRGYTPETFYDDSLMRELDESGFIDGVYRGLAQERSGMELRR